MICKLLRGRAGALILFAALTTPFATLAHFGAEAASLGARAGEVLLSVHHLYLVVLNLLALAALVCALGLGAPHAERRRRVATLVAALPGRGRGPEFFAAAVVLQLAFFGLTQLVEGDPVAAGHLALGLSAALVASCIGAVIIAACKVRILRVIAALPQWIAAQRVESGRPLPRRPRIVALSQRPFASLSVSNRPPPLSAI